MSQRKLTIEVIESEDCQSYQMTCESNFSASELKNCDTTFMLLSRRFVDFFLGTKMLLDQADKAANEHPGSRRLQ